MNPIFYIDPSEINLFDDNEFESASIYVTKSHFDGNSVPVYTEQPVDYERLKISAKQRELELLAVIENIKEAIGKADIPRGMLAILDAFKIEPSQALREHDDELISKVCSIVYGQCASDNVAQRTVDAIRLMAEERRKK